MKTMQPVNDLVRTVPWRDLVKLSIREKCVELTLSLPWLAGGLACYALGGPWIVAGLGGTFFFFLTGLRQSHNAQHYAMGIGRRAQDLVLLVLSVLMMMSMHSVQVIHLIHHRHCLDENDVEAAHANKRWWQVLLTGPAFPVLIIRTALRKGTAEKRAWIVAELLFMTAWLVLVLCVLHVSALRWHLGAVLLGECFTAFFAVWTVHHGCDADHTIARTQRGWMKNFISYSMFYHLEHHAFPAVPTSHLPRLAARLDAAEPGFGRLRVW